MRALIIEDEFTAREMLKQMLSRHGVCDLAETGEAGLELWRKASMEGKPYDLVCLDIMLPEMDGHTVLEKIRLLEDAKGIEVGGGTKVVMTTAVSTSRSLLRAFNAQCEAYLVKPVKREDLERHLLGFGLVRG